MARNDGTWNFSGDDTGEFEFASLYEMPLYPNLMTDTFGPSQMGGSTYRHRPRRNRGTRGSNHPWRPKNRQ